ncbi:MAG: hypothetical protein D6815_10970, partial [Candidatus Dadabacteria bacterium]
MFNPRAKQSRIERPVWPPAWLVVAAATGFLSLLAQLVGLREFVSAWSGNELVVGVFLACSLLATAAGSYGGRRLQVPACALAALLAVAGLLPLLEVLLIRSLRGVMSAAAAPSLGMITLLAAGALVPVCPLFGLLLVESARMTAGRVPATSAYWAESAGAVAGGLFYTVSFSFSLPVTAASAAAVLVSTMAAAWLLYLRRHTAVALAVAGAGAIGLVLAFVAPLSAISLLGWFPGQRVVLETDGPYGDIVVTQAGGERFLYENGLPVAASNDPRAAEEIVHFALVQRPKPRRVLLVGGLAIGADREIAKYGVERIDAVEIDRALLEAASWLRRQAASSSAGNPWAAPVRVWLEDPRAFVRRAPGPYDVAIVAGADPRTAAGARLYTEEFFRAVSACLTPGGVVAVALEGSGNYRSAAELDLLRSLRSTLARVFTNVLALPGARVVFLASNERLASEIAARIERAGIQTAFASRAYLAADLSPERVGALARDLAAPAIVNRDLRPSIHRLYLRRWMAELGGSGLGPAVLLAGALAGLLKATLGGGARAVRVAIATTGLASMTLEVALLLAFQMARGALYLQLGLLVAAFMAGSAAGARMGIAGRLRTGGRGLVTLVEICVAAAAVVAAAACRASLGPLASSAGAAIGACIFATGFLTGLEMPLAAALLDRRGSEYGAAGAGSRSLAELYAADLTGAAAGAATAAIAVVPAIGVVGACLAMATLKAATAVWVATEQRAAAPVVATEALPVRALARALLVAIVVLALWPATHLALYSFSFTSGYHGLLLGLLAAGLAATLVLRPHAWAASGRRLGRALLWWRSTAARAGHTVAFSLATFYPLARCYFQVPFLFCHVCPRVCVFGYLRPFWVPAAVLMNLGSYSWCQRMCPLGAAFEPTAVAARRRRARRLASAVRFG